MCALRNRMERCQSRIDSPSTACGESFALFLGNEDDDDDDGADDGRRRSDVGRSRWRPPPFLPPVPLAAAASAYLTASMKGFPTPVTLFAVR